MEAYENLLDSFIDKLNTLENVLPFSLAKLQIEAKESSDEFFRYIHAKCTVTSENDDGMEYEVPLAEIRTYKEKKGKLDDFSLAIDIVGRSYVVTLVSQYDQFISELISIIFKEKPELLSELGKQLSVAELSKFDSIEKVLEEVISKEIDAVMRQGHLDHIDYIEKKIKGSIREDKDLVRRFVELTERRNLFVHTDGIVSKQYIDTCKSEGIELSSDITVGKQLSVDPKYFYACVATLNEFAVKMVTFAAKKLHPDKIDMAKDLLIYAIYKNLDLMNFKIVRNLVKYASKFCKLNRSEEMIIAVNNVLSYYLAGKKDEAKKLLEAMDWSDCSDRFKLARQVITEDYAEACKTMKKIGSEGEVEEVDYHQWPLFNEFRETDGFRLTYKEVFGTEFDVVEQKSTAEAVVEAITGSEDKTDLTGEFEVVPS